MELLGGMKQELGGEKGSCSRSELQAHGCVGGVIPPAWPGGELSSSPEGNLEP